MASAPVIKSQSKSGLKVVAHVHIPGSGGNLAPVSISAGVRSPIGKSDTGLAVLASADPKPIAAPKITNSTATRFQNFLAFSCNSPISFLLCKAPIMPKIMNAKVFSKTTCP